MQWIGVKLRRVSGRDFASTASTPQVGPGPSRLGSQQSLPSNSGRARAARPAPVARAYGMQRAPHPRSGISVEAQPLRPVVLAMPTPAWPRRDRAAAPAHSGPAAAGSIRVRGRRRLEAQWRTQTAQSARPTRGLRPLTGAQSVLPSRVVQSAAPPRPARPMVRHGRPGSACFGHMFDSKANTATRQDRRASLGIHGPHRTA